MGDHTTWLQTNVAGIRSLKWQLKFAEQEATSTVPHSQVDQVQVVCTVWMTICQTSNPQHHGNGGGDYWANLTSKAAWHSAWGSLTYTKSYKAVADGSLCEAVLVMEEHWTRSSLSKIREQFEEAKKDLCKRGLDDGGNWWVASVARQQGTTTS